MALSPRDMLARMLLMRRFEEMVITLARAHKLGRQHFLSRQIRGHPGKESRVVDQGEVPSRNRGAAGAEVGHGEGERIDQRVEVEQFVDLAAAQAEHASG